MSWKEKDFEEHMSKYIDRIYRKIFGSKLLSIYRSNRSVNTDTRTLFMDTELAIDTHLTFTDGSIICCQEKTLQYSKMKYNQFTFEYYNDPVNKVKGEWFKLGAQLYFFGYAKKNLDGYEKFWILDIAQLRIKLLRGLSIEELESKYLRCNPPPAKANFFAIPFELLETMKGVIFCESI